MIPLWSKDPIPDHAVLLRPITWRLPRLRELPDPSKRAPYPRLWTIFTRVLFCVAEGVLLVWVVRYRNGVDAVERDGYEARAGVAIAGIATACALDGVITLAAIVGVYDAKVHAIMGSFDVLDIALCVAGLYYLAANELPNEWYYLDGGRFTAMVITGVIMGVHVLFFAGGLAGCCMSFARHRAAKKAKRVAAEGNARADIELSAGLPAADGGADAAANKASTSTK